MLAQKAAFWGGVRCRPLQARSSRKSNGPRSMDLSSLIKLLRKTTVIRTYYKHKKLYVPYFLLTIYQVKVYVYKYIYIYFFTNIYFPPSGQAVVTGVVPFSPPGSCLQFCIAHRVLANPLLVVLHRVLLTQTLSRFPRVNWCTRKSPHDFFTSMHSGGLELTKVTCTKLEDNLIRRRGDRSCMYCWVLTTMLPRKQAHLCRTISSIRRQMRRAGGFTGPFLRLQ